MMKILSLTKPTVKILWRILERKTGKILQRRLERNSKAIDPPEIIANMKLKSNNGYSNSGVNAIVSLLPFFGG
jgi:hypothetical protein